jgi:hypothetical protein
MHLDGFVYHWTRTQKQLTHKVPLALGVHKSVVLRSQASLDYLSLCLFVLIFYCNSLCYNQGRSIFNNLISFIYFLINFVVSFMTVLSFLS